MKAPKQMARTQRTATKTPPRETMTRERLMAAIMKLVDLVDGWLTFTPFEFITWDNANEVNSQFPQEWPDGEWIGTIEPRYSIEVKQIDAACEFLEKVTANDVACRNALRELSDDIDSVKIENRKQGFKPRHLGWSQNDGRIAATIGGIGAELG
jgi:hypothetical protein